MTLLQYSLVILKVPLGAAAADCCDDAGNDSIHIKQPNRYIELDISIKYYSPPIRPGPPAALLVRAACTSSSDSSITFEGDKLLVSVCFETPGIQLPTLYMHVIAVFCHDGRDGKASVLPFAHIRHLLPRFPYPSRSALTATEQQGAPSRPCTGTPHTSQK